MGVQTSFGRINDNDFSNLLQALSATAKGRAFLAEYRRRLRPEDTGNLVGALERIETTIATVRDQLQPERIADELRCITMTLEIALDGAVADADGDEPARRLALVSHARSDLEKLTAGLIGQATPSAIDLGAVEAAVAAAPSATTEDGKVTYLRQPATDPSALLPDR